MLEVIRAAASASKARVAILDFDGTVSLIRTGWADVMIPLCMERLAVLKTGESEAELRSVVEDFVWRLTGKETIYQMMALADAVRVRGGTPLDPLAYKKIYLDRLWTRISGRVEGLRRGSLDPAQFMVPGTRELLEALRERGLQLHLASGTDDANVKEEATLLGLAPYFDGRIYGAQEDPQSFSKALLVRQLVSGAGRSGDQLLVVGDGYVEIEEGKKVGGAAVGVASAEPECLTIDEWKRKRLIGAGADFILPNYLSRQELLTALFEESAVPA